MESSNNTLQDFLYLRKEFNSYSEVKDFVQVLRDKFYQPVRKGKSKRIETYNKQLKKGHLSEEWVFKNIEYVCAHSGDHVFKGVAGENGVIKRRERQRVFPCHCPFQFNIVLKPKLLKFVITKCVIGHSGHPISRDHIKIYQRKKRLQEKERSFLTASLAAGAKPMLLRNVLREKGIYVKSKDLQNLKQVVTGFPTDEWKLTSECLNSLNKEEGNVVKVLYSENDNIIQAIFLQLREQKVLYNLYGEVIQMDGTYKTNKSNMPLYTLLIEDGNGIGQPVCMFFVRHEITEMLVQCLQIFKENNDITKTKYAIVDKDCAEISSLKEIFCTANVFLCQFHALKAVDTKLHSSGVEKNFREQVYNTFYKSVYTKDIEHFHRFREELNSIESYSLGKYFKKNWFNQEKMWASIHRVGSFIMANNTTNRIERYHRTIKDCMNGSTRMPKLINVLVDIAKLRIRDFNMITIENELKTNTIEIGLALLKLSKRISPYAWNLVFNEYGHSKRTMNLIKSRDNYRVITEKNCYELSFDFSRCNCEFNSGYELPCRHMIHFILLKQMEFGDETWNQRWDINAQTRVSNGDAALMIPPNKSENINIFRKMTECSEKITKPLTKNQKFLHSNILFTQISNNLCEMPAKMFQSYMAIFGTILEKVKKGEDICLYEGTLQQSISQEKKNETILTNKQHSDPQMSPQVIPEFNIHLENNHKSAPIPTTLDLPKNYSRNGRQPNRTSVHHFSTKRNRRKETEIELVENSTEKRQIEKTKGNIGNAQLLSSVTIETETNLCIDGDDLSILSLPTPKTNVDCCQRMTFIDRHKQIPKVFKNKDENQKNIVILSWLIGTKNAKKIVKCGTQRIDCSMLKENNRINAAISEQVDNKNSFFNLKKYFDDDCWMRVIQLAESLKESEGTFFCNVCNKEAIGSVIGCDSCMEWNHLKCEKLKVPPESNNYICNNCRIVD